MIPFLDLKAQYASIGPELESAALEVLRSTHYALGPQVEAFERNFAEACDVRHAIAVNSGTSAIVLALQAAGIGEGSAVITVPLTFVATIAAIEQVGARPVLVDVDPLTRCMDVSLLEAAIVPGVKAIIPVHLHGLPSNMDEINRLAEHHGITVIEDAAQAHGASINSRPAGSFGHCGCFSFYPGKNLGAAGEGGCVVTNDDDLDRVIRSLRDWGQVGKSNHVYKGTNARMDAIQGAILNVKLGYLEEWTNSRRELAGHYSANIMKSGLVSKGVGIPTVPDGYDSSFHVYAIEVANREFIISSLNKVGIGTSIHYPVPVHLQPAFANLGYGSGSFPTSERLAGQLLSLPLYPEMTKSMVDEVVAALSDIVTESSLEQKLDAS
jgi:dTDP-4-amino-4,6-dideoxygalactose transaminase